MSNLKSNIVQHQYPKFSYFSAKCTVKIRSYNWAYCQKLRFFSSFLPHWRLSEEVCQVCSISDDKLPPCNKVPLPFVHTYCIYSIHKYLYCKTETLKFICWTLYTVQYSMSNRNLFSQSRDFFPLMKAES